MAQRTISPVDPTMTLQAAIEAIGDDDVVVADASGEPRAAVMSIERYKRFQDLERAEKRRDALARLDEIEAEYAAQPNKLTPEEVEELADRFSREMVEDLVREGKITFEELSAS